MFYQRVLPLLGNQPKEKSIGIINPKDSLRVIQFLASCGIVKYKIKGSIFDLEIIRKNLEKHNQLEKYEISLLEEKDSIDLLINILPENSNIEELKKHSEIILTGGFIESGEYYIGLNTIPENVNYSQNISYFNWFDFNNQISHFAISLLLEGTFQEQKDLSEYLREKQILFSGNPGWYWSASKIPNFGASQKTKVCKITKTVMILGCGSVGSVISDCLFPLIEKLILIDPGTVSEFNPVRQEYHTYQTGQKKVNALKENLMDKYPEINNEIISVDKELTLENLNEFEELLELYNPDLVILSTATTDEYFLAKLLWEKKIPHFTARCYPRAKWSELIIVVPPETPCFGCMRGNLYTGPSPSLTPEQIARYNPYYREGELEEEPALKTDSARCAEIASRIAIQMISEEKEFWFQSLIKHKKTCLIGGNRVEKQGEYYCYGIDIPGKVVAFGLENLNTGNECLFCGRRF